MRSWNLYAILIPMRFGSLLPLTLAASIALYFPACGSDGPAPSGETPATSSAKATASGVLLTGGTNEAALSLILDATAVSDAKKGANVSWPDTDETLPASKPFLFWWRPATASIDGLPPPTKDRTPRRHPFAFGPERSAWAQASPLSGRVYLAVFSTAANPKLLRIFTTEMSYQPDTAAWKTLCDAQAPITLTVTTAVYDQGRLVPGKEPTSGDAVTFTIK